MRRTHFFKHFEYFSNLLIMNTLQPCSQFLSPNCAQNQLTFKFLFRHTFKTVNYTLLNNSPEISRFFTPKQEFF